jgi:hypothetical protein
MEKTGTDSFQRFCEENSRFLLGHGVLYPVHGPVFGAHSHKPLVSCYLPYRDLGMGQRLARADLLRFLRGEIRAAKPDIVLISAEHFSSRFGDAEIAQLARDFADYICRIAVVVREHGSRVRSAYAQTILAGRTLSFEDYCNEIFYPENRYVRYRDTIAPWDRTFGRENMHVISVAPGTNVVDMLCQELIPQVAWVRTDRSYWENKSLGASATEALRQVNMVLPSLEPQREDLASRLKWLLLHLVRYRVRGLIAAAAGDRPRDSFRMSEQNRARLEEIADVDRQWLAANYNLRLETLVADRQPPPDDTLAKSLAAQVKERPWVKLLMAIR